MLSSDILTLISNKVSYHDNNDNIVTVKKVHSIISRDYLQDMCDDYINFVIIVLSLGSISSVLLKNTPSTSKSHIQVCCFTLKFRETILAL